ncbi:MAG: PAS domain-containing protein [Acidobacteriota bacterium]
MCDDSFDLIQRISPEGRFLFVNQAWLDTLGYTREEVDGLALPDIIHPDDRVRFDQTWRRLLAEKTTVRTAA